MADDLQRDRVRLEANAQPPTAPAPGRDDRSVSLQPHMPMANVPKKPKHEPKPFSASAPKTAASSAIGSKPKAKEGRSGAETASAAAGSRALAPPPKATKAPSKTS